MTVEAIEMRGEMMLAQDLNRVRANVRAADTEDLLDRATVYRGGMEPAAVEIVEEELRRRGVTAGQQADHAQMREQTVLFLDGGTARSCSLCRRPAVEQRWAWHRLFGLLPVFLRRFAYCEKHGRPAE